MVTSSISDVVTASVYLEKTRLKKLIMIIATPQAQRERSKVIGLGILIYIYIERENAIALSDIYVCGQKKLNRTLAIDLPFQTFAVGLLVEFIDWF